VINRTKALLAGGAVTLALGFGALGTAMAQDDATPTPTPTPTPREQQEQAPPDRGDRPDHPCPDEEGQDTSAGASDAILY
jgi:hypothetical protein